MTGNEIANKLGYELKKSKFQYKKAIFKHGVKIGDFNVHEFIDYLKKKGEYIND